MKCEDTQMKLFRSSIIIIYFPYLVNYVFIKLVEDKIYALIYIGNGRLKYIELHDVYPRKSSGL